MLNALGVLAVADFLAIPFETYQVAMGQFEGVARRFTVRGEVGGATVVDDFGHHPAEVRATLNGARANFAGRRIGAAFQPHRYTRTRDQLAEFARAFHDADKVVICAIFAAGEKPIDGITSEALVRLPIDTPATGTTEGLFLSVDPVIDGVPFIELEQAMVAGKAMVQQWLTCREIGK